MKVEDFIVYLVLIINLVLCIIACANSYKTLNYMKYSDYVLNDALLQYVYNVENSVERNK